MIEIGRFGDFNDSRKRESVAFPSANGMDADTDKLYEKTFSYTYPQIYKLLTETTAFYEQHFGEMIAKVAREKRRMEFETPNRVRLTNEYELENTEALKNGEYYLFNTRDRLSWLTIFTDDKQVAVVSRKRVMELLRNCLKTELGRLASQIKKSQEDLVEYLYEMSDGKPCFISCNSNVKSIRLSYYDSVLSDKNKATNKGSKYLQPILEKSITYMYRPLAPISNCWFYVRSPKDFNISIVDDSKRANIERQSSQDFEVQSMVIKGSKERQIVRFDIDVKVPVGLKWWYISIYWISITAIVFALFLIAMHLRVDVSNDSWWNVMIRNAGKGWYAIVAALITTRGWMMHESHAFNFLSKSYTIFVILLLVEAFVMAGLNFGK